MINCKIIFKPAFIPTLLCAMMIAIMVALGLWQKDRAVWKADLLTHLTQQLNAKPELLPISALSQKGDKNALLAEEGALELLKPFDLKLMKVQGHFLPKPVFFRPVSSDEYGRGFEVIAPFKAQEGIVIVNLGFIPDTYKEKPATTYIPQKNMELVGFLRLPQKDGGKMLKDGDLIANIPFMSFYQVFKSELLPLSLSATGGQFKPYPKGRGAEFFIGNIPNNHIVYMWTWFALAVILMVIYTLWHYYTGRLRFEEKLKKDNVVD